MKIIKRPIEEIKMIAITKIYDRDRRKNAMRWSRSFSDRGQPESRNENITTRKKDCSTSYLESRKEDLRPRTASRFISSKEIRTWEQVTLSQEVRMWEQGLLHMLPCIKKPWPQNHDCFTCALLQLKFNGCKFASHDANHSINLLLSHWARSALFSK